MNTNDKSLMHGRGDKRWLCIELAAMGYREAWDLQTNLVTARKDKIIDTNVVLVRGTSLNTQMVRGTSLNTQITQSSR